MNDKNRISFSLRRLLVVPVIFAVLFALMPQKEAAIFVLIAATGSSLLLFLVNLDNLPSIIMSSLGCLLGGWLGTSANIVGGLHRTNIEDEVVQITIGIVCGYLFIKLLEWIIGAWVKYMTYGKETIESELIQQ